MQCNQTVRCQPGHHNNIEHSFGRECTDLFTDILNFIVILTANLDQFNEYVVHASGGMLVAYGMLIWYLDIAYGSKLLNLESFYPCQPVDLNASMKKDTWMDQNNEAMTQCVSTTDTDYVKAKSLNSTNAQDAQVE